MHLLTITPFEARLPAKELANSLGLACSISVGSTTVVELSSVDDEPAFLELLADYIKQRNADRKASEAVRKPAGAY